MALAMLVGNANVISWSLFSPANTLAALLANQFPEADPIEVGALMYAALVLLAITLVVNMRRDADPPARSSGREGADANGIDLAQFNDSIATVDLSAVWSDRCASRVSLFSFVMSVLTGTATIAAMVPLFSVLFMLL